MDGQVKYTRDELSAIIALRHGQRETVGTNAYLDLRIKATPELLEQMLGGHWVSRDGSEARFEGVYVDADGYATPLFTAVKL